MIEGNKIICKKCGEEMDFATVVETEAIPQENFLMVVERWECLECDTMELIEFTGKITNIKRIEVK